MQTLKCFWRLVGQPSETRSWEVRVGAVGHDRPVQIMLKVV